jgi:rhodanese-related sulfurtransferase
MKTGGLALDIGQFFKQIPKISADETRDFLKQKGIGEYNLVDVRQPAEYEKGHLPGARLIPVGELTSRLGELDPKKPTIVY